MARFSPFSTDDVDILDFEPRPESRLTTALQRFWHSPRFYGMDNIDQETPALYVANHTIFGVLDAPMIVEELYLRTGVYLRALADRMHFSMPWGRTLLTYGAVEGSRENCSRLMDAGQPILVFPGGGREVSKRKGEQYQLTWKKRTGFARMAIQHGYPIVPVASVGPDDSFTIRYDADDLIASPLGKLLKATGILDRYLRGGDIIFPLVTGVGPTMIPRPERFYIKFGKPIPTAQFAGDVSKENLWALREKTEAAIYEQIAEMQEIQAEDPARRIQPKFR